MNKFVTEGRKIKPSKQISNGQPAAETVNRSKTKMPVDEVDKLKLLLEEKETYVVHLKQTIDQLLNEKGVINYVNNLKQEAKRLNHQNDLLKNKNKELHSFLVENNKIYSANKIDQLEIEERAVDEYATLESLKLENKGLRSAIRYERTLKSKEMTQKDMMISRFRNEVDMLRFKLNSRNQIVNGYGINEVRRTGTLSNLNADDVDDLKVDPD